jgi:hypothetical protein
MSASGRSAVRVAARCLAHRNDVMVTSEREADDIGEAVMTTVTTRLWRRARVALTFGVMTVFMAGTLDAQQRSKPDEVPTIGVARMRPDGTIELQLRATSPPGGPVGHRLFEFPPDHPRYQEVLRHLGGLKPGEVKSVPPWPD